MRRKLVAQGSTTLVVSVPKAFIKRYNLKKGDEVEIADADTQILVGPTDSSKRKAFMVFDEHTPAQIRYFIKNAYRAGVDIITIECEDKELLEYVQEVVQYHLLGVELFAVGDNTYRLETISEPSLQEFEKMFCKVLQQYSYFVKETITRLKGKDSFEDYGMIESNINKYDNFCRRYITKNRVPRESFYVNFLSDMVSSTREFYNVHRYLDENPHIKFESGMFQYAEQVLKKITSAYTKKKVDVLAKIDTVTHEIWKEMKADFNKPTIDTFALHRFAMAVHMMFLSTSPLAGILLEYESERADEKD